MAIHIKDILATQKKMSEEQPSQERMSIAEFRKLLAEGQNETKEQTTILTKSEKTLEEQTVIQLSQQTEQAKANAAGKEAFDQMSESLAKINDGINKQVKAVNNLSKKLSEEDSEKVSGLAKGTGPAYGPLEKLMMKFGDLKKALSPERLKRVAFEKANIVGIFNKKLAKEDYIKQQQASGSKLSKKELGSQFSEVNRLRKQTAENEKEYETTRKLSGLEEKDFDTTEHGQRLKKERSELAEQYAPFDIRASIITKGTNEESEKVKKERAKVEEKRDTAKKESQSALDFSPEGDLETARRDDAMLETLKKIEENTRGTHDVEKLGKTAGEGIGFGVKLGQRLKKEHSALTEQYAPLDIHASIITKGTNEESEKVKKERAKVEEKRDTAKKESQSALDFSPEGDLETARRNDAILETLKKIEENTRGVHDAEKANKTASEGTGGGFGAKLGKFGDAMGKMGGVAKNLLAFSAALWVTSKAFANFSQLDWSGITKGVVATTSLALASKLLGSGGNAKALLALGGAVWVISKAFANFADLDWSAVGKGIVAVGGLALVSKALSDNIGSMLKGALGLVALGGALYIIGSALQTFMEISWEDMGKAAVAIAGLAASAALIGTFAAPITLGAAVLAGLGAALYIVGAAIKETAEGFNGMVDSITKLGDMNGDNLIKVGAGIAAVGAGIAVFAAGNAAAGLANLVSGFLNLLTPGKTPIEQLMDLAKVGPDLEKAGLGIKALAEGLQALSNIDKETIKAIAALPVDKLAAMGTAIGKMQAENAKSSEANKPTAIGKMQAENAKSSEVGKPAANDASIVSGKSAENQKTAIDNQSAKSAPVVINAPSTVNNSSKQNITMPAPIRNEDSGYNRYVGKNIVFA